MSTAKELISEKYIGRLAGTEENKLAAEYIADYFKQLGLENPKGLENYMQYYQQPVVELTEEPVMDGTYNPGALDNASGPAAMMELARVIKESKVAPKQKYLYLLLYSLRKVMLNYVMI